MFVNEIGCLFARSENKFQKSAALALGADFAAANEIALRDDTDEFTGRIDHRKPADMLLEHVICSFDNRRLRRDGDDGAGHDLMGAHGDLRRFEIKASFGYAIPTGMLHFDTGQAAAEFVGLMQLNTTTEQDRSISNIQDRRSS